MTYPSGSGTIVNNWGPAYPNAPIGATPQPTGQIVVPQSPSGVPLLEPYVGANGVTVSQSPALFNYNASETSTENFVSQMTAARNEGTPFNNEPTTNLPVDGKFDTETIPVGPGGSEGSEGTSAVNAPCSFNSLNPAQFQTIRWE